MAGETLAEGIEVAVATRDEWSKTVTFCWTDLNFRCCTATGLNCKNSWCKKGTASEFVSLTGMTDLATTCDA